MIDYTYSEVKQIKEFCEELHSEPDWREVVEALASSDGVFDFEVNNVRFIEESHIDEIQQNDLSADEYALGCFNAWFLADVLDIDSDAIEAMQESEAYAAIGKLVLSMGKLKELQEAYAIADGYGHHFNHYDGSEEELKVSGYTWLVFDNH